MAKNGLILYQDQSSMPGNSSLEHFWSMKALFSVLMAARDIKKAKKSQIWPNFSDTYGRI